MSSQTLDYFASSILLRSGDVSKQLSALKTSVIPLLSNNIPPTEEVIRALIENGLTSEKSSLVRILSFKCIQILYKQKSRAFWNEVRTAILTEMGTAEDAIALGAAISTIEFITDPEKVKFVGSKDGMSAIKSCCSAQDSNIRSMSVKCLGPLLLKVWLLTESISIIEGYNRFESMVEARRMKEDIRDFIKDIMKDFAYGSIGKLHGSETGLLFPDVRCTALAYFHVLNETLRLYNEPNDVVGDWMKCILGINILHLSSSQLRLRARNAIAIAPLLKVILPILCTNPYVLMARCRKLSYPPEMTLFIGELIITLLSENMQQCSSIVGVEMGTMVSNQFSAINDQGGTAASCEIPLPINIVQLASEWVMLNLSGQLASAVEPNQIIPLAKHALLISHDERLVVCRRQVWYESIRHCVYINMIRKIISLYKNTTKLTSYFTVFLITLLSTILSLHVCISCLIL